MPAFIQTWTSEMNGAMFAPRMAALSLGVLGLLGQIGIAALAPFAFWLAFVGLALLVVALMVKGL